MVEVYEFIRDSARMLQDAERLDFAARLEQPGLRARGHAAWRSESFAVLATWARDLTPGEMRRLAQDLRTVPAIPDGTAFRTARIDLPPLREVAPLREAGQPAPDRNDAAYVLEVGLATCERLETIADRTGLTPLRLCITAGGGEGLDAEVKRMNEVDYAAWFATGTTAVGPERGCRDWRLSLVWRDDGTVTPGVQMLNDRLVSGAMGQERAREVERFMRYATASRDLGAFSQTAEGRRLCETASIEDGYLQRYTCEPGSRPLRSKHIVVLDPAADVAHLTRLFSRLVS